MHRPKFPLQEDTIQFILKAITQYGVEVFPQPGGEIFIDMDNLIFYEVALEKREDAAYLVTGNQQHYPIKDFIVTPASLRTSLFSLLQISICSTEKISDLIYLLLYLAK